MSNRLKSIFFIFCFLINFLASAYEVEFLGVEDEETLNLLKSASQLEKFKDSETSLAALKRRAESDMPHLVQVLHSKALYNGKATYKINEEDHTVSITIVPGQIYPLASFRINYTQNGEKKENLPSTPISLEELKIKIGEPATPESILNAEDILLDKLNVQGYAYAKITNRDAFADQLNHSVIVLVDVETGPKTYFGQTKINGLDRVNESFILKKIKWQTENLYDPNKINKTQEALDLSGLFKSVNITLSEEPVNKDQVELNITVIEGKQRSIGFGVNFTTEFGPGFSAEWEDRNIFGNGEKLGFRADIWAQMQNGSFSYLIPDYLRADQNLIWLLNYEHRRTKAYTESAFSLSATIERKINARLIFSYGLMYKNLVSERSENNGTFNLLKVPFLLKWNNVDNILDPSKGVSVHLRCVPSLQVLSPQFAYCINTMTTTYYKDIFGDKKDIFAAKVTLGSIFGAGKRDIPPPERFYAGSENTLRGYRYLTVSPIDYHRHHKPIGGRFMFIYSLEWRKRISEDFGIVGFYDIGNVYLDALPKSNKGMLQSIGLGVRYYTPIGPLRFDVAIPLNRRKHIDNYLEAYFSIGQSF